MHPSHESFSDRSLAHAENGEASNAAGNGMAEAASGSRFAVICTHLEWEQWQRDAVERFAFRGCGRLMKVFRLIATHTGNAQGATTCNTVTRRGPGTFDLSLLAECHAIEHGHGVWELDDVGVAAIRALNLDFLLVFGLHRLRGEVLNVARHGAWAFPGFGTREINRCAGTAFWPIYNNEPHTTIALVRLAPNPGGDIVLKRGILRTQTTYGRNFALLTRTLGEWPATVASMLAAGSPLGGETFSAVNWANAVRSPSNLQRLRSIALALVRLAELPARFALCYDLWHVGIARTNIRRILAEGLTVEIEWAPPPRFGLFYADPMGFATKAGMKVFCECYSYWQAKADIRALHYAAGGGWSPRVETVIAEPFHLSYPAFLTMDNRTYCVPETCEAGLAYRYPVSPDGVIEGHRTTFIDFEVADPTLVEHEGNWYLFGAAAREAQYILRIWFSQTPEGPWTPHPANPVKCDVHTARPAGPFVRIDGRLYRPSQNSGTSYGASVNLMEILELSPMAFREILVRTIEPNSDWRFAQGMHTLTQTPEGVLIDAKIVRISPVALLLRIVNLIQRLRRSRRTALLRSRP